MKSPIALSALVLLPLTAATAQTPAGDRAHARDCAVMQALVAERGAGRGALGIAPDSFGLDCDWIKKLGSSPAEPVATPGWHYGYMRPEYSPDGLQAMEEYYQVYRGEFIHMSSFRCTLKEGRGDWHLVGCRVWSSAP
jgi:hypothetical protein